MDIKIFSLMLKDEHFTDYNKMRYKYAESFNDFLHTLEDLYYKSLPLYDFEDKSIVFIENHAAINQSSIKILFPLNALTKYCIVNSKSSA